MAWWWPFGRKKRPEDALEAWHRDLAAWLETVTAVFSSFPDHADFDGVQVDEKTARVMAEITDLYTGDACELVAQLQLKSERLRRYIEARKSKGALPPV